ncbi:Hypothetical_protein [Hexamita inflata]|uniref:Hypothetical_protein n=1 Tax=Hexamita inflata TaxID=28002 RepID=A0AA86UQT6_9EUKA|nr:Hypothetical protein HINF_LOCUS55665 [Hexamita inflata]
MLLSRKAYERDVIELKAPSLSTMKRFKSDIISEIEDLDVLIGIVNSLLVGVVFCNIKKNMVLVQRRKLLVLLLLMPAFLISKYEKMNTVTSITSLKPLFQMVLLNKKRQIQAFATYLFQLRQMHHLFYYFSNFMIQVTQLNPQSRLCSKQRQN